MIKQRVFFSVFVLAAVFAASGTSYADDRFSARSLKGRYTFSGSGTLLGAPAAVVGLTRFDGAGGCAVAAVLISPPAGGVVPLNSATCEYSVNADGSGSQTITFAGFGSFTSHLVLVSSKEIHFALSDSFGGGTVASGISKKQSGGEDD